MVLLDWLRLTHHNYKFAEAEREVALMAKVDPLAAKVATKNIVEEQQEEIVGLRHER